MDTCSIKRHKRMLVRALNTECAQARQVYVGKTFIAQTSTTPIHMRVQRIDNGGTVVLLAWRVTPIYETVVFRLRDFLSMVECGSLIPTQRSFCASPAYLLRRLWFLMS